MLRSKQWKVWSTAMIEKLTSFYRKQLQHIQQTLQGFGTWEKRNSCGDLCIQLGFLSGSTSNCSREKWDPKRKNVWDGRNESRLKHLWLRWLESHKTAEYQRKGSCSAQEICIEYSSVFGWIQRHKQCDALSYIRFFKGFNFIYI